MTESSLIDAALIQAYREALYCFPVGSGEQSIRIGSTSADLDALLKARGVTRAIFITAVNPHSKPQSEAFNAWALAQLRARLSSTADVLTGVARDPGGRWPPEPTLLAVGLSRETGMALAQAFEQNAFVYVEIGGAAELVLTA
jgi:Protein of unknown function (DUF3293)